MATLDTNFTSSLLKGDTESTNSLIGGKDRYWNDAQGAYNDGSYHSNKIMRYPQDIISGSTDYFKIEVLEHLNRGNGFQDGYDNLFSGKEETVTLKTTEGLNRKNDDGSDMSFTGTSIVGGEVQEISQTLYKARTQQTIILPVPQSVNDNNSTGWGRNEINDWAAWGIQRINDVATTVTAGNAAAGLKATILDAGEMVKESPGSSGVEWLKSKLISSAANVLGSNVTPSGLLARTTGQIINTNVELLFNSVTLRSFTFNWNLTPRSKSEAEEVKKIIRTLKQTSSARKGDDKNFGFLNTPHLYRVSYMKGSGKHPFLNSFKHCALANIQMNYTGSGTYATYDDGTPVHMNMGMTFQELNPIYAEDYDDANAGSGVGY